MYASGNRGGSEKASIKLSFDSTSSGQIAMVIYEWNDVHYLGVELPASDSSEEEEGYLPKTYICTSSAVRAGLCPSSELGEFIVSLPTDNPRIKSINDTSIVTEGIKFDFSSGTEVSKVRNRRADRRDDDDDDDEEEEEENEDDDDDVDETNGKSGVSKGSDSESVDDEDDDDDDEDEDSPAVKPAVTTAAPTPTSTHRTGKKPPHNPIATVTNSVDKELNEEEPAATTTTGKSSPKVTSTPTSSKPPKTIVYSKPIEYAVKKTGYYCVGIVPVTLLSTRSEESLIHSLRLLETRDGEYSEKRKGHVKSNGHSSATFSGEVEFKNIFKGELSASEYPKIKFYFSLTCVYILFAAVWGFICFKHRNQLLPIQFYISGTLLYLTIEMFIYFVYYSYLNKHGSRGAASTAFLVLVATLNSGRNSLSFFLLLIVSMGLSVVTPSLGNVMNRIRLLTGLHFFFGVIYSVGTVEIELETASLVLIMFLIFPLAFTLTSFLMWTIISLNTTILHLSARKQRFKLMMFQRLYRILMAAVIAVGAFFVISSISLSNRGNENYAPMGWKWRWFLLDGSLCLIYLAVFSGIAFLWRPTPHNVHFSMSDELAQDEAEADAEDYEIEALERRGQPIPGEDGDVEYGHLEHPENEEDEETAADRRRKKEEARSGAGNGPADGRVVFSIDDEEEDEEELGATSRSTKKNVVEKEANEEGEDEDEQLMGKSGKDD